jgi:hypothetical protein
MLNAARSPSGFLVSQSFRCGEQILYMGLQSAGYRLNFARGYGSPFYFSIFQIQNQFINRSRGFVQKFTGVFMLCRGHSLLIPF